MRLFSRRKRGASNGRAATWRNGDTSTENLANSSKDSLYLYLSDAEWRAQFVSPEGTPSSERLGESLVIENGENGRDNSQVADNSIVARAIGEIGRRRLRSVGRISILLNDPGIVLVDNLDGHFSSTNVAMLRQYGAENLRCEEISYGFARFGVTDNTASASGRADQGVFGFIDAARLRRYLNQLDRLAINTVLIAPAAQNTVFEAQVHPEETRCGLYFGARSTTAVVCNASHGGVTMRSIPIGILSLVAAVAEANNVSRKDALAALEQRDCISQVVVDTASTGRTEDHIPGQFERILGETVRTLGNEVERTLEFFDVQRMGGRPGAIQSYGPTTHIKGLTDWLGKRLDLPVVDANETLLNDLIERPRADGLNLLEGAKSPLITIGKVHHVWDKDQFRKENERADDDSENILKQITSSDKEGSSREPAKSERTAASRREVERNRSNARRRARSRPGQQASDQQKNERAGVLLLLLFVFGSLYGGYTSFIAPEYKQFNNLIGSYVGSLQQNSTLRRKAEGESTPDRVAQAPDKVLWTEKFLALGCYASKDIWLTDVFLTTGSKTVQGKPQSVKKLTIKGAVLPSTDGHLLKIAKYIDRLEKDDYDLFMDDFKQITFEGAAVDLEDVEEIVRFTIEGWYDKDKRTGSGRNGKRKGSSKPSFPNISMTGCLPAKERDVATGAGTDAQPAKFSP